MKIGFSWPLSISVALFVSLFFLQRCSSRSPWLIFYWLITQNSSSFDSVPSSWLPAISWQEKDAQCSMRAGNRKAHWSRALRSELEASSWRRGILPLQKKNVCFYWCEAPAQLSLGFYSHSATFMTLKLSLKLHTAMGECVNMSVFFF